MYFIEEEGTCHTSNSLLLVRIDLIPLIFRILENHFEIHRCYLKVRSSLGTGMTRSSLPIPLFETASFQIGHMFWALWLKGRVPLEDEEMTYHALQIAHAVAHPSTAGLFWQLTNDPSSLSITSAKQQPL